MKRSVRIVASETLTAKELAVNFGISHQSAHYYRTRHGMPNATNGIYNTAQIVDWLRNERGWTVEVL